MNMNIAPIHFVFIVHGHQGHSKQLSYLHNAVKSKANDDGSFANVKTSDWQMPVNKGSNEKKIRRDKRDRSLSSSASPSEIHNSRMDEQPKILLVVHNTICNEGRTNDGIIMGGERLADEMLSVIRYEVKLNDNSQQQVESQKELQQQGSTDVTISIIGNSLGGLYARYAITHLCERLKVDEANNQEEVGNKILLFDEHIRIHLQVFCSIASPHLGCAGHTYVPIPRVAEIVVAKVLGKTGADLFRLNDLILMMTTSPRFLTPLASFSRRIAYANLYRTDFPVPCSTALFLDVESDYPHFFVHRTKENDSPVVATLRTAPLQQKKEKMDDRLTSSLDSLGWTKVLVDLRDDITTISLPIKSWRTGCPISTMESLSSEVTSSDLAMATSTFNNYRLSLPSGHNAICAIIDNSAGRAVMDCLAIDLINEISYGGPRL